MSFSTITALLTQGEQAQLISSDRLGDLKNDLSAFRDCEPLNSFQRWIIDSHYSLDLPPADFAIRSILLIAVPRPPYATIDLEFRGERIRCLSLVTGDFDDRARDLGRALSSQGLQVIPAPNVPLKRLAARTGLATYGRNNICYVEGLGSHFSLLAFFTELPFEHNRWAELRLSAACEHCMACLRSCPTGAIRQERFLIDNERCLSYINEGAGAFPEWLPASAHHSLYDCLLCQQRCPMNRGLDNRAIGPILLSQEETEALLAGTPANKLSPDLREKARRLGLHNLPTEAIARNVQALLHDSRRNGSL